MTRHPTAVLLKRERFVHLLDVQQPNPGRTVLPPKRGRGFGIGAGRAAALARLISGARAKKPKIPNRLLASAAFLTYSVLIPHRCPVCVNVLA